MGRIDFDGVAREYDDARALPLRDLEAWRRALAPFLAAPPEGDVLDVGCGTGLFAFAFAVWFGVPVLGVDPSTAMLDEARQKREHQLVRYVQGDALALPVADAACRAAWFSTVLHHVSDLRACAHETRRALAPSGRVLVRSFFPDGEEHVTLFRFFPEAARVAATFPSVEQTLAAFGSAGFGLEHRARVPQTTAANLRAFRDMVRRRADTTLRTISDEAFARGLAALDQAVLAEPESGRPVEDALEFLVLR